MAKHGHPYNPPKKYAKVDPERAARIAKAYEEMPHDPHHPLVKAAYNALARETLQQYHHAKQQGFKAEFWDPATERDPYEASPRLATEDVRQNHHMYVYPTDHGYGDEPIEGVVKTYRQPFSRANHDAFVDGDLVIGEVRGQQVVFAYDRDRRRASGLAVAP